MRKGSDGKIEQTGERGIVTHVRHEHSLASLFFASS